MTTPYPHLTRLLATRYHPPKMAEVMLELYLSSEGWSDYGRWREYRRSFAGALRYLIPRRHQLLRERAVERHHSPVEPLSPPTPTRGTSNPTTAPQGAQKETAP